MMDITELNSSHPFSSTSSLSSSSEPNTHPLSIGGKSWLVGEKTIRQILSVIQPTTYSEYRRREIIRYLQRLIGDAFGIKVFPFGSVPLKTYLPHGDVDLTAVSHSGSSEVLAAEICSLLESEEKHNATIPVRDVLCVPAQVRVVKCIVGDIDVDISFNQTAGLSALYFLEQVDQFIGKDHLFKRSVILIKAWCYYESRLLGAYHGLISTYALETMVLHVINLFHSSLHCPLAVLYKFLEYYSTFDWKNHCIGINGLIILSSLPKIEVVLLRGCDELLLPEEFLRSCRDSFSPSSGVVGSNNTVFPVKFINILDPLRDDNNLGRSVSQGNFYRIRYALSLGAQKLGDILMLPPEKIGVGLEKFFKNTLERNGKGRRADVSVPVPTYGATLSSADSGSDSTGQYDQWFDGCNMPYGVLHNTSATSQTWNNGWMDVGQNMIFDHNGYYDVDESSPSSVYTSRDLRLNHSISVEERWRLSRCFSSVDSARTLQATNVAPVEEKWRRKGMPYSFYNPRGLQVEGASLAEENWKPRRTYSWEYNQRGGQPENAAFAEEMWKTRRTLFSEYSQRGAQSENAASAEEKWEMRAMNSSVFNPRGLILDNAASAEDKWKSRGTYSGADNQRCHKLKTTASGVEKWKPSRLASTAEENWRSNAACPYTPNIETILQTNLKLEESVKEQEYRKEGESDKEDETKEGERDKEDETKEGESDKEDETVHSLACTSREEDLSSDVAEDSPAAIYSMEEFPLLPGSKPIPIRECPLAYKKHGQVKETSMSPDSTVLMDSKVTSPTYLSLSGKQSDSDDGSVYVDAPSDPIVVVEEIANSPESKEIVEVPVKPLLLADTEEFPPLCRPSKPLMPLSKKEFPPLKACLNSKRKNKSKNSGKVQTGRLNG